MRHTNKIAQWFENFANRVTLIAGSSIAFFIAFFIILGWIASGPMFNFSDTWQLVINTGTTIVTFLMVFIIQKSQNKEAIALQLKLNELIAANEKASNRLINIEDMTEEELRILHKHYSRMAALAQKENNIHASHSIDQADRKHAEKSKSQIRSNSFNKPSSSPSHKSFAQNTSKNNPAQKPTQPNASHNKPPHHKPPHQNSSNSKRVRKSPEH